MTPTPCSPQAPTSPAPGGTTVLAAGHSDRGELLLRTRATGAAEVTELVVNGVFAMDSVDTSSERALAALVPSGARRVLVGGLGLGYTATAVLERVDLALAAVDVVELEELLVGWARQGRTPVLGALARDARVRLHVGNVAEVWSGRAGPAGPWEAILLDVDNGPDFLIHEANAVLYGPDLLAAAYRRLAPGGVLAIWCQGPSPQLLARLRDLGRPQEHLHRVTRERRSFDHVVYTLDRPARG